MNKLAFTALIMLSIALTGCAGSKLLSSMWEQHGFLRVAEPDSSTHNYKFYIKAGRDFGVNTQNKKDRLLMIRGYLQDACKDVEIVDEQFLPSGGTALGDLKLGTYISKVKCINPA